MFLVIQFGPPRSSIYLPNSSNVTSGSFTSSQTNHPTLYTNTAYLPFSGLQQQTGFGNFNTDNLAQFQQQQQDVTASLQHILSQLPPATTTTSGNAISMNPGIPGQSSFPQPQFSSFSTPLYGHHANQVSTGGFSDYSTGSFTGQIYPNSVDTFDPTDNASESASTYSRYAMFHKPFNDVYNIILYVSRYYSVFLSIARFASRHVKRRVGQK